MNENQITHPAETREPITEQVRFGSEPVTNIGEPIGQYPPEPQRESDSTREEFRVRAEELRARAGQALERSEAYVRENPMPVLLGTLALGIVLGLAAGRRSAPTARERYLEEPAMRARDVLYAAIAPVARRLRDQYSRAEVGVNEISDRFADMDRRRGMKPLFKQARRFGQMLKFW